ncbi:hypothetical protein IAT38_006758 [Cryptococcus sp. DSM 104549]
MADALYSSYIAHPDQSDYTHPLPQYQSSDASSDYLPSPQLHAGYTLPQTHSPFLRINSPVRLFGNSPSTWDPSTQPIFPLTLAPITTLTLPPMRLPSPPLTSLGPASYSGPGSYSSLSTLSAQAHAHASLAPLGGQGVPCQTGSPNEIFGHAASLHGSAGDTQSERGGVRRSSSGHAGVRQVNIDGDDADDDDETDEDDEDDESDDDRSDYGEELGKGKAYAYTTTRAGHGGEEEEGDDVTVVLGPDPTSYSTSTSSSAPRYSVGAAGEVSGQGAADGGLDPWDVAALFDYEGGTSVGVVDHDQVKEAHGDQPSGSSGASHSTTATATHIAQTPAHHSPLAVPQLPPSPPSASANTAPATRKPVSGRLSALGKIQLAARGRRGRPPAAASRPSPRATVPAARATTISTPAPAPSPAPAKPKTKRPSRPSAVPAPGPINPEDIPIPAHLRAVRSSSRVRNSARSTSVGPGAALALAGRGASPRVERPVQPSARVPAATLAQGRVTSRVASHRAEPEAESDSELSVINSTDGDSPGGSVYELPDEPAKKGRGRGRVSGRGARVEAVAGSGAGRGGGRAEGGRGKKRTRDSGDHGEIGGEEEEVKPRVTKRSRTSRTSRTAHTCTPPTSTHDAPDPADASELEEIKPRTAARRRVTNPARSRQNKEAQYRYRTKKKVVAKKTWDYAIKLASLLSSALRGEEKKKMLDLTDEYLACADSFACVGCVGVAIDQGFAAEFLTATGM